LTLNFIFIEPLIGRDRTARIAEGVVRRLVEFVG
jgi:hypothetical protein